MKTTGLLITALTGAALLASCGGGTKSSMPNVKAPEVPKKEHLMVNHGDTLRDDYFWLREKSNPEVIKHLETENAYCDTMMYATRGLQDELFTEMKARIKEEDESVPVRRGENYYYSKTVAGKQYREYYRKRGSLSAQPELLLDCNALAEGKAYFSLGDFSLSPDQRYLAYSTDTDGGERYTVQVKDLETGKLLSDELADASDISWSTDNKTFFYTIRDEAWRPYKIMRHTLGVAQKDDKSVYQEKDERFTVSTGLTKDRKYIMLSIHSTTTDEVRMIPADKPTAEFKVFSPREQGIEYDVYSCGDRFYVRTNADGAVNFKLMELTGTATERKNWKELIAHNPKVKIEDVDEFKDYLVLSVREDGLNKLAVRKIADGTTEYITMPDPTYTLAQRGNPNFDDTKTQYVYSSMVRPTTTYEYDMAAKTQTVLKQDTLAVPYNPDDYTSERIYATAADGVQVPISIVYKKGMEKNGHNPTLLYGYGSYGVSMDAGFSSSRISLLDRGFVYAIAHIRGGADMGEQWYLDGKLMKKKNTFTDFIACAEKLVADKYTTPEHLGIMGGSAGGLLMGAVTNMRPDLFTAVVAQVPFVDLMNTICDASLPLTVGEYEEWGNPTADKAAYEYMKSYSPYDNITKKAYPNILATAGLNDPRVSYWEPAKWVLKLRENNTSGSVILLKTNMGAGHGGASGRYNYLKDVALDYAFLINILGSHKH